MIQEGSVREINARKAKSKRDAPTTDDATPVNLQSAQAQPQQQTLKQPYSRIKRLPLFLHPRPL